MPSIYGNPSPSITIIRYSDPSVFEDRLGRQDVLLSDNVVFEEIVEKIHDIILVDRRTKMQEIANAVDMLEQRSIFCMTTWE